MQRYSGSRTAPVISEPYSWPGIITYFCCSKIRFNKGGTVWLSKLFMDHGRGALSSTCRLPIRSFHFCSFEASKAMTCLLNPFHPCFILLIDYAILRAKSICLSLKSKCQQLLTCIKQPLRAEPFLLRRWTSLVLIPVFLAQLLMIEQSTWPWPNHLFF